MDNIESGFRRVEVIGLIKRVDLETGLRLLHQHCQLVLGFTPKASDSPLKLLPYWDSLVAPKTKAQRKRRWREFNHMVYRCQEGFLDWMETQEVKALIKNLDL